MRGLIYKENAIFFKSIDKRIGIIAAGAIILLMYNSGIYAGLFASIMLAMTIGIQNITSFSTDEKAGWKKYQLALPVSGFSAVAGKYISVICTLAVSLLGSILLNVLSSVIFRNFDADIWKAALFLSILIPLVWTGICLPLTYWFGFNSSRVMGMILIIPMFYTIRYFEDGSGMRIMADSIGSYITAISIAAIILFGVSIMVSAAGYERRK